MYQSLHTTVIDDNGIIFEVQIRTWDMHYTAEYGIAAHWKYKAGITSKDSMEDKLAWVKKLLENQQDVSDIDDIVRTIKYDLTSDEVYFFTPKGDVKCLPVGSTVIDFAYSIHSQIGDKLIGARVDGKIVPITYEIQTGQVVKVLTSNNPDQGPSRDWIKIVKTSQAKNKIRSWFKKEKREENIITGKQEFEKELRRNRIFFKEDEYVDFLNLIIKKYHYNTIDEFFAAIGYGGLYISKIITGVRDLYNRKYKSQEDVKTLVTPQRESKKFKAGVIVEDLEDCLIKFSKCCSPLPGDDIVGFVTKGYGVSIHRADCKNVAAMKCDNIYDDRWVKVSWVQSDDSKEIFKCGIKIIANNDDRLLADITTMLANFKVLVYNFNAQEYGDDIIIDVVIGVCNLSQLKKIKSKILTIKSVIKVER